MTTRPLEGRRALVTGASRGIGRATALRLAEDGARVALAARSLERVEEAVEEIRRKVGDADCIAVACDVSEPQSVDALVEAVVERFGGIDILVNNAGITRDNLLFRLRDEDWRDVLETNLTGMFYTCRRVARGMLRERYGRIINVSSISGLVGNPGQSNYAAAKAGIIGFTYALAKELAGRGITVNAVAPGFIETDMTASLGEETRKAALERIPLGRMGNAGEVADAIAFLAGPRASYITGEVLRVDGGLAIGW